MYSNTSTKVSFKAITSYLVTLLLLLCSASSYSQTISGKVKNKNGEELISAYITAPAEKGIGAITDDNGNFYFESAGNYDILIVSFVGYDKVELKLVPGLNKDLKRVLKSGISLNEVTVYTGKTSK